MATIIGRVTKDAVSKTTSNGKQLVEFSFIEVYSYKKDGERREIKTFYNCVIWNNDKIAQYLVKGKPMQLTGTIAANPYTAQDGTPKATLRLTVKGYEFLPTSYNKNKQQSKEQTAAVTEPAADDTPF